jgi:hypothetical protein
MKSLMNRIHTNSPPKVSYQDHLLPSCESNQFIRSAIPRTRTNRYGW